MHLEEFAEGQSFFHRIDPRVKFISFFPYLFLIALLPGWRASAAAFILSLSFVIWARLDKRRLINRLAIVNAFILILWLFLPFSHPGETLFQLGALSVTREGIIYVLAITFKTNAIVLTTIVVLGTSEVFSLTHALVHLKVPAKLVHLFFFFYRYLSVLHEEYTSLRNAMLIRCFRPGSNLHTYRSFAFLIGMLIVRSYDRSQRIYQAMLCRGFKNKFHLVRHFHLHREDGIFAVLMVCSASLICLIGIGDYGN